MTTTTEFNEGNEAMLTNISQLQTAEMKLYDKLADKQLSIAKKERIITEINQISQIRITAYENLMNTYENIEKNASDSDDILRNQLVAINIIEKELNRLKVQMNRAEIDKNNKLRLIEINTYYSKYYRANTKIVKAIGVVLILLFIVWFLQSREFLPSSISGFLVSLILLFGGIYIGWRVMDNMSRNNINYDEYNWNFNAETAPSTSTMNDPSDDLSNDPWTTTVAPCVGAQCCLQGSVYDSEKNMCVV